MMKIIFAGTPAFSVPILSHLIEAGHEICLVLTQPDRPVGRGQKSQYSPVKTFALTKGLTISQPENLKNEAIQMLLKAQDADVMIVAAYGLLLPSLVLNLPKYGCINVHASLLPKWRGAAPIPYAILSGENQTGVTIMQMDKGLDTGDMLAKASINIEETDTSASLHDKLSQLGANLLVSCLNEKDQWQAKKQDPIKATHAPKITKEAAKLDWNKSAQQLCREVRAYFPWPISYFELKGQVIRVHQARYEMYPNTQPPGTIVSCTADALQIACHEGVFIPEVLQFPSKNPLKWRDVFNAKQKQFLEGSQLSS